MLQGNRYLESPILGVQSRLHARRRHPDSQNPHLYSVQSCAPGPTTHFEGNVSLMEYMRTEYDDPLTD
jgi:hypothetical protein